MEAETHASPHERLSPSLKNTLLVINCMVLSIGHCGGPLVTRLYFIHGGKRVWLSSCLLTAGWPFILVIFLATFWFRRASLSDYTAKLFNIRPRLFLASAVIAILAGVDDYIYAYGVARLPVSTVALIIASQLVFTAGFAYTCYISVIFMYFVGIFFKNIRIANFFLKRVCLVCANEHMLSAEFYMFKRF